jgi:aryl-alcohol dehydrogenase-like predicted oxidoreductase
VEQRRVGRSGLSVSELGLGTMLWGRDVDLDGAAELVIAFRDAGGTLVDTASSYGDGAAERILGQILGDVVARDEIAVSTKAGIVRRGDQRLVDASRGTLLGQLDGSLRSLGVDWVDLWQVHVPDALVPMEETLGALDYAVSSGKARYVGVSNYPGWRTAAAASWQRAVPGRAPIASTQMEYSLLARGIEREVVPACLELGIGVLPYAALGGGVLTAKYRHGIPGDSRASVGDRYGDRVRARLEGPAVGIVEAIATAADGLATSPLAVSLSWLLGRPAVASAIVGARTVGQLTSMLTGAALTMPAEIVEALDEVSAPSRSYPEDAA